MTQIKVSGEHLGTNMTTKHFLHSHLGERDKVMSKKRALFSNKPRDWNMVDGWHREPPYLHRYKKLLL